MRQILGNETIKEHFMAAVRQDKVSHAYILEGEKGMGKKLLTQFFSSLLQCEAPLQDGHACGKCQSCIQIANGNHPDLVFVKHEKSNSIGVDDIKSQIVHTVDIMPYKGPYKIYIVDEAEKMTVQAQNTLLKTIEEPPHYVVLFLLTSNRGNFLQTILSRCVLLPMKAVNPALVKQYLIEKYYVPEEMADFSARFSMGNVGKAIEMSAREQFDLMKDHIVEVLGTVHEMEPYELALKTEVFKEWKDAMPAYFDMMRMWVRDLLVCKAVLDVDEQKKHLFFIKEYDKIIRQSDKISFEALNQMLCEIEEAQQRIQSNVNLETVMELLFLRMHRIM